LPAGLWKKVTASHCRSQGKTGTKAIKEMAGITIGISFKKKMKKEIGHIQSHYKKVNR